MMELQNSLLPSETTQWGVPNVHTHGLKRAVATESAFVFSNDWSMMYIQNASVITMTCLNGPSFARGPKRSICMRSFGFEAAGRACMGALGL